MPSFEKEIKDYLAANNISYTDNTASMDDLDFVLNNHNEIADFFIDAKEKTQAYNTTNWNMISPTDEQYSFIIDDLAARKLLKVAPHSGLFIRDNLNNKYYWLSVLDLYLMPKVRARRAIQKTNLIYKGKWIIDFRSGKECNNISELFDALNEYLDSFESIFSDGLDCYGIYHNELIHQQGITRRPSHWKDDVNKTR